MYLVSYPKSKCPSISWTSEKKQTRRHSQGLAEGGKL